MVGIRLWDCDFLTALVNLVSIRGEIVQFMESFVGVHEDQEEYWDLYIYHFPPYTRM